MDKLEALITPQSNESLGDYVQRQRRRLGLTQREVALKAEIHPQSYGKVERGQTTQLNQRTQRGLAYALQVPEEYLGALSRGIAVAVEKQRALRFLSPMLDARVSAGSIMVGLTGAILFCLWDEVAESLSGLPTANHFFKTSFLSLLW